MAESWRLRPRRRVRVRNRRSIRRSRTAGISKWITAGASIYRRQARIRDRLEWSTAAASGVLRASTWQHVAVVVKRGGINLSRVYVNGALAGKGDITAANLDNPKADLVIGRTPQGKQFRGKVA